MKASFIVCSQNRKKTKELERQIETCLGDKEQVICIMNSTSIAKGYNDGARMARNPVLVFLHDDVKLRFSREEWDKFLQEVNKAGNGIGGVAGFRKVELDANGSLWPPIGGFGSGGCLHESENSVWYTTFGLFGHTLTVDGIFLAMTRTVFDELDGFDTGYPGWHWYDTDITFRSHLLCYRNFTYPLLIQHGTTNYRKDGYCLDQKEFFKHANIFYNKHKDMLPQLVECDNEELEQRVFSREPRWGQVKNIA